MFTDAMVTALGNDPHTHILRILLDTSCHSLIAGFIWIASTEVEYNFNVIPLSIGGRWCILQKYIETVLSMLIGSAVDIDHFVAAGSISLTAATHLPTRPWGHAVLSCVVVTLLVWTLIFAAVKLQHRFPYKLSIGTPLTTAVAHRFALLTFSAYFAHLLRDSVRRGLWLCTISSRDSISNETSESAHNKHNVSIGTPPLPLWVVFVAYFSLPVLNRLILTHTMVSYAQLHDKILNANVDEIKFPSVKNRTYCMNFV